MVKQSRAMSLIESLVNVAVGYSLAVITQLIIFPWFDLPARVGDALTMGVAFTVVSILRSYILRRIFESLRTTTRTERSTVTTGDQRPFAPDDVVWTATGGKLENGEVIWFYHPKERG